MEARQLTCGKKYTERAFSYNSASHFFVCRLVLMQDLPSMSHADNTVINEENPHGNPFHGNGDPMDPLYVQIPRSDPAQ